MDCIFNVFALLRFTLIEVVVGRSVFLTNLPHALIQVPALREPLALLLHGFIVLLFSRFSRSLFSRTLRFDAGLHLLLKKIPLPCLLC